MTENTNNESFQYFSQTSNNSPVLVSNSPIENAYKKITIQWNVIPYCLVRYTKAGIPLHNWGFLLGFCFALLFMFTCRLFFPTGGSTWYRKISGWGLFLDVCIQIPYRQQRHDFQKGDELESDDIRIWLGIAIGNCDTVVSWTSRNNYL